MGYIKTLPLPPPRCRSVPHQLPPASAVCIYAFKGQKSHENQGFFSTVGLQALSKQRV